jgi:hypothetical protein
MRRLSIIAGVLFLLATLAGPAQARDEQIQFTKWFSPAFPSMMGFVDDQPVGSFTGQVLDHVVPTMDDQFDLLEAEYTVSTGNPSTSFTALIAGEETVASGKAVLTGLVTKGPLTGQPVHVEFTQRTNCPGAPAGACFQGTIRVGGRDGGE